MTSHQAVQSHQTYATALQEHRPVGITELTTMDRPPFLDRVNPLPLCSTRDKSMLATLPDLDPDIIIFNAAWMYDRCNWSTTGAQDCPRKILGEIKSKAPRARVVIIGPEIRWEPSLPKRLISFIEENKQMPPKYLSAPPAWFVPEARKMEEPMRQIAKENGATYIPPRDMICEGERCLTRFGDRQEDLLIFDCGHLTSSGSKFLVSRIEKDIF